MSLLEAFLPGLFVIGICLAVIPFMPRDQNWARALVTGLALIVTLRYMVWRLAATLLPADFGTAEGLWILFCFVIEALALVDICVFFLLMSRTSNRTPEADAHEAHLRTMATGALPAVDVFIPTYNEEIDVLERTVVGALGIDYPNYTVWVLDDGKRDWLRDFCIAKGVNYVTRPDNSHAKAGNINHALARSSGDFVAIFDADFVPQANFLYRTIGFFDDAKIGCVQTPQHFFNKDPLQANLAMRDLWPDEQRLFFDHIMASRDAWNVAFSCGSCGILRREALDAMGGIPTESVTEDILTTLKMYRLGYITRYLNERLSSGLAPETLDAFFVQRQRWCRGGIQTLYLRAGPLGPGLTIGQRVFFLPLHWMVQQPARFLALLIPIVYLWINMSPLGPVSLEDILYFQLPLFPIYIMGMRWLTPSAYMPIISTATNVLTAFRLMPSAMASMIRPFGTSFRVTPKGVGRDAQRHDSTILWSCIGLIVVTAAGILINVSPSTQIVSTNAFFPIAFCWAVLNVILLFFVALMCVEAPRFRNEERFLIEEDARCRLFGGQMACRVLDISRTGALVQPMTVSVPDPGTPLTFEIPDVGLLSARVVRKSGRNAGIQFDTPDASTAMRLARMIDGMKIRVIEKIERAERLLINESARLTSDDRSVACRLVNLSQTGAQLWFDSGKPPDPGTEFVLEVDASDEDSGLAQLGRLAGEVVRVTGKRAGVRFHALNDAAAARLDKALESVKYGSGRDARPSERVPLDMIANCMMDSDVVECRVIDISASGAMVGLDTRKLPEPGMQMSLILDGVGEIPARVIRAMGDNIGVQFEYFDEEVRDRLIQRIFTRGLSNSSLAGTVGEVSVALFKRAFGPV